MGMIMKIYALVSENDYYKFRAKCSREGKDIGEAFSSLVHLYSNDLKLSLPKGNGRRPEVKEEQNDKFGDQKEVG